MVIQNITYRLRRQTPWLIPAIRFLTIPRCCIFAFMEKGFVDPGRESAQDFFRALDFG